MLILALIAAASLKVDANAGNSKFDATFDAPLEAERSPEEARALELALEGAPFAEICGAFGDPASAFEALQTWIGEGWLTAPGSPG